MKKEKPFLIYPWDMSVTNSWTTQGLHGLRDVAINEIAEILNGEGSEEIYISAMAEYLAHGYVRKAAEVTRAMIKGTPSVKDLVTNRFNESLAKQLLRTKLEYLPANPSEFPKNMLIEYVQ